MGSNYLIAKRSSILIFLIVIAFAASAQQQNVYYLNKAGQQVVSRDSAEYIRIIREPDSGTVNYKLIEVSLDNTVRRTGFVSEYDPELVYEGVIVNFENGHKSQVISYEKGQLKGSSTYYYPNGKVKKTLEYANGTEYKLIDFFDSTGVKLAQNGTGTVKDDSKFFFEGGSYLNGVKTGKWKGVNKTNESSFEEEYDPSGKLISGVSVKSGVSYPYTRMEELPTFPGGDKAWIRFVEHYKYPADAIRAKVSGKIRIGFIVEETGKLKDVKITQSVFPSMDGEALRLLKSSPLWLPGKQRGIPVKVSYSQTLALNLGF